MRLIDAEKLIEEFSGTGNFDAVEVRSRIAYAPTAHDLNKVVEQLEKLKKQNPFINGIRDNSIEAAASRQTLDYAIDIVKAGAKQ